MKLITRLLLIILLFTTICAAFSSFSIMMAGTKTGVRSKEAKSCKTRYDFLKLKPYVLSSDRLEDGSLVEVYQYPIDKSSPTRAVGHGILDICTCGLWELAGGAIEDSLEETVLEYYQVRVSFDANDRAASVEFL